MICVTFAWRLSVSRKLIGDAAMHTDLSRIKLRSEMCTIVSRPFIGRIKTLKRRLIRSHWRLFDDVVIFARSTETRRPIPTINISTYILIRISASPVWASWTPIDSFLLFLVFLFFVCAPIHPEQQRNSLFHLLLLLFSWFSRWLT